MTHEERQRIETGKCPSYRWYPYDNGPDDFGYQEWWCDLVLGHAGDHESTSKQEAADAADVMERVMGG